MNNKPENSSSIKVKGQVESLCNNCIVGWAQYKDDLTQAVLIDVYEGDNHLDTIQANLDTVILGVLKNFGHCGFSFSVPGEYLSGNQRLLKFVEQGNQEPLPGSPFKVGRGSFDSKFKIKNGRFLEGQIQQRTSEKTGYSLKLLLDNKVFWQENFQGGKLQAINLELPESVFDNQHHIIQIKIFDQQDKLVLLTMRKLKHSYQGLVEKLSFDKISGWLVNTEHPDVAVSIELAINGSKAIQTSCNISRQDVQKKNQLSTDKVGFSVDLPPSLLLNSATSIEVFIKGTDYRVLSKKYILTPKDIAIRSLISAAEQLNSVLPEQQNITLSAGLQVSNDANTWVRQQIIAPLINQLRQQAGMTTQLKLSINPVTQVPVIEKDLVIDIIIPVYQGYEETIACIDSVSNAKNNISCEIIVINDLSPDGRLTYKLQALAKEKTFTLLENQINLGFVATVNIGLGLHKGRDVVILNSDTEVYDYWLDRMQNTAQKNNNIATVTPFSNNATICSFPGFNQDNPLNQTFSLKQLNQWFAELNNQKSVDLPTAVGFCMLIKREVLESIGYLDEKTWQKGYGEENDFCLRSSTFGWRHVLAADVFVQHHGSVSFADDKQFWLETNLPKLNQLYPDYSATVQRFILQDPVAQYRNTVIKKMLHQQSDNHILFIMHDLGGGAKTHAVHMTGLLEEQGHAVLELIASETQWELKDSTGQLCMKYRYPEDYKQLESDLKELGVWRIHFHQLIGFPECIWQLAESLSCAYDFTAHDFLPICPRITMIDESGRYCGQSQFDTDKCQRCIQLNGLPQLEGFDNLWREYNQSVNHWREEFEQKLIAADNVFCPSQSTAKIYKSHYALKNIQVKEHPEAIFNIQKPKLDSQNKMVNVAVIGAIGEHKGSHLVLSCAKHALKEGLSLHFVIIGFTDINDSFNQLDNVTITGEYENSEQLQKHIQTYECQIALFLSIWPETFCYTLTEALQNNLYPVALNYGAIAERIKKLKFGTLLPTNSTARDINKKLINGEIETENQKNSITYQGAQYPDIIEDYYHVDKS